MENENKSKSSNNICPWYQRATSIIWVQGHGQCAICGINIDECCRGENCSPAEQQNIQSTKENPNGNQ